MTTRSSHYFTIATLLIFGLRASAAPQSSSLPTVEEQMKVLTEKLDLSRDQQTRFKPILQQLREVTLRLMQDTSLSQDERLAQVRPWRYKTDRRMREILTGAQKKKLDQYEQGPHSEMHGTLTGAGPS